MRDGFRATGEVRLLDARIDGNLECVGGRFANPKCHAFNADSAEIRGGVFLQNGFHATGEVRLLGARIAGELNGSGGRFNNPCGHALNADGVQVGGSIFLTSYTSNYADEFHARGEVRLPGARIGGQLICSGGKFENPQGVALGLDHANVNGDVRLDSGLHATGEVRLLGARISGQLNCSDGTFENPGGTALNLQGVRANSLWLRKVRLKSAGVIDLVETDVSLLADDPVAPASQEVSVRLDGFVYKRIAPGSPRDVKTRLQWLERQPEGYHPQPYEQLAEVFRRNGQDYEARDVLIAKRRKRRITLLHGRRLGWPRRLWDWFLDWSVRYGWQPWRPLIFGLVSYLLVLVLVFVSRANGLVVGLSDVVSPYDPIVHVLDVFLPIVDLGVESRWTIDTANGGRFAWVVTWLLWSLKLVGWGTVTLALAALTGIVKRE